METILRDVRYAGRNLLKARGFTFAALITLALGIGANTAMFTVVNAVLLRPLPFRQPQRLVALGEYDTRRGPAAPKGSLSYPNFADIRSRSHSLESAAAYQDSDFTITGINRPFHVKGEIVSASIFQVLGVQPKLGRAFLEAEDSPGHNVAILSDTFWRAHFNGAREAIGKTIRLNGQPYAIVGVMPPGFTFPVAAKAPSLWITFSQTATSTNPPDLPITVQRGAHFLSAIARIKPGVRLDAVNAELTSIARSLAAEYPNSNAYGGMGALPEMERLTEDAREPLLILFGAVGLVLLIACANVANLVLARSTGRAREIAVRSAIGATRGRIVRQLVTESLVLSLLGAGLGVGLAVWGVAAVLKLYPANLPRAAGIRVDPWTLLFTAGLAVLSSILFGLVPALQASKPNLTDAMRDGRSVTSGRGHNRLRSALVIAETALGVMLLAGAGLLLRSFDRVTRIDLGFNPSHVLTGSFDLAQSYTPDQQDRFVNELLERIRVLPGVARAAGALPLPLSQDGWEISFNFIDHPVPGEDEPSAGFYVVTPGFFETLQVPLLQGRAFDRHDQRNSPPVMVVNQAFARKFFPNENPIGKRIKIGIGEGAARAAYKTRQIVGVVGNIRAAQVRKTPQTAYFIPLSQLMLGAPVLTIRTAGDSSVVAGEVRKTLFAMDPSAPFYDVRNLDDYLALDIGLSKFQTVLLSLFAGIALLLTAVGLYGVMAYSVAQRTHEIGVRRTLGATSSDVLRLVLQRGLTLTLAGVGLGLMGALLLGRYIESLLYQVKPRDPITYAAVCIILGVVASLACWVPALRALRVDPMVALRCE